ncbi:hypothetical protein EBR21_11900, partial [bacterium]|nr:hypothetical protein [bacterium]
MMSDLKVHAKFSFSLIVLLSSACTSYDYGSGGDFYYEVPDPENPLWNEGISELVEKKCATCHT